MTSQPASIPDCDRELDRVRAAFERAVENGDTVKALEQHAELDRLLDVRLHLPLQRPPSDPAAP